MKGSTLTRVLVLMIEVFSLTESSLAFLVGKSFTEPYVFVSNVT